MPEEIIPGLFRVSIPLLNDSLDSVNVYAIVSEDGLRLVDSGWNTPETYTTIVDELQQLGRQVSDIRDILVTYNHPDHIGQAERFGQEAGARLFLHRLDTSSNYADTEDRLQTNGMPREERETIMRGMRRMPSRFPTYQPDIILEGGEVLAWNPSVNWQATY